MVGRFPHTDGAVEMLLTEGAGTCRWWREAKLADKHAAVPAGLAVRETTSTTVADWTLVLAEVPTATGPLNWMAAIAREEEAFFRGGVRDG